MLRRPAPTGLGGAYRAGFHWGLERGYEVLVEMDSDLSHDPLVLPELLHAVAGGADLAIGSRYVEGGGTKDWPWLRRMVSRNGCRYAQTMLRLPAARLDVGVPGLPGRRAARGRPRRRCAPTATASRWR